MPGQFRASLGNAGSTPPPEPPTPAMGSQKNPSKGLPMRTLSQENKRTHF